MGNKKTKKTRYIRVRVTPEEYQIIKWAREDGIYWYYIPELLVKFVGGDEMPESTLRKRYQQETIRREKEDKI